MLSGIYGSGLGAGTTKESTSVLTRPWCTLWKTSKRTICIFRLVTKSQFMNHICDGSGTHVAIQGVDLPWQSEPGRIWSHFYCSRHVISRPQTTFLLVISPVLCAHTEGLLLQLSKKELVAIVNPLCSVLKPRWITEEYVRQLSKNNW